MRKNLLVLLLASIAQRTFVKELLEEKGFNVPERIFNQDFTEAPLLCINNLNKIAVPIVESIINAQSLDVEYIGMEEFIQHVNSIPDPVAEPNEASIEVEEDVVTPVITGLYEDDQDETNNCEITTYSNDSMEFTSDDGSVTVDVEVIEHIIEIHRLEVKADTSDVIRNSCACPTAAIENEIQEDTIIDLDAKYPGMKMQGELGAHYATLPHELRKGIYNMTLEAFLHNKKESGEEIVITLPTFEEFDEIQLA